MKSKLSILLLAVLCLSVINSCKKKDDKDSKENLDSNVQQFNDDSNRYKSESDQADNAINRNRYY